MSNLSIAQKEMQRIVEKMRADAGQQAEKQLRQTAIQLARMAYSMMDGFYNVTGNTANSIGVALYYKKRLVFVATSAEQLDQPATRKTLREGEMYNKKYYWDGTPARARYGNGKRTRPFVGKVGTESFYAANMVQRMVREKVTMPTDWSFKIVTAVPYAKYLEQHRGANVITETHDMLASAGGWVTDIQGA